MRRTTGCSDRAGPPWSTRRPRPTPDVSCTRSGGPRWASCPGRSRSSRRTSRGRADRRRHLSMTRQSLVFSHHAPVWHPPAWLLRHQQRESPGPREATHRPPDHHGLPHCLYQGPRGSASSRNRRDRLGPIASGGPQRVAAATCPRRPRQGRRRRACRRTALPARGPPASLCASCAAWLSQLAVGF